MQHIDVKIHGQIATILLDRSQVRNSLNPGLLDDLQLALSDVHQEKRVRAVVLTGAGNHFCSGVDLCTLQQMGDLSDLESLTQYHQYWRLLAETIEQMLRFPKPLVAAVDGSAIGAGLGIALACDLVVASKNARFAAVASRRGLVGGITAALLSFRLGGSVAARLALTGQAIDSDEAYRIGLCGPPVDSNQIWVEASQVAESCCYGPAEATQATKRILNETVGENLLSQIAAAAADSAAACSTPAASEGIAAFLGSREPNWPH